MEEQVATTEETANPVMDQAVSAGWKPKEEFEGDPNTWVDYPEFVRRGELFDAIKNTKKEVRELKKTLSDLSAHHKRTAETERRNVLEALKNEKKQALADGNYDRVVEVDDVIADVKAAPVQAQPEASSTLVFDSWIQDNQWYEKDKTLKVFADSMAKEILAESPNIPPEAFYTEVTKLVKQEFPHKFEKPSGPAGNKVAGRPAINGRVNGVSSSQVTYASLSPEEQQMHDRFVRRGVMKSEDYMKEISAQRAQKRN